MKSEIQNKSKVLEFQITQFKEVTAYECKTDSIT